MTDISRFEQLQADADVELAKAQAKHALLSSVSAALPREVAAPRNIRDFGYCADVSLNFDEDQGVIESLLAAYPAEPLVLVRDSTLTQKPIAYLRDTERDAVVLPLAPVVRKGNRDEAAIVWWTRLSTGHMAQIQVRNGTLEEYTALVSAPKYLQDSHCYSTGFTNYGLRKLVEVAAAPSALQTWCTAWDDFAKAEAYNGGRLSFLKALRGCILKPLVRNWREQRLPEPRWFPQGGAAVAIPPGREPVEYLEELRTKEAARQDHWLDRVGDFWRHFDRDAATRLWTFSLQQADALPGVELRNAQQAAEVADVLADLFVKGAPQDEPLIWCYIHHHVQARTGLAPSIRVATVRRAAKELELDIRLWGLSERADTRLTVQANVDRVLRPQDVPVTYVD